MKIHEHTERHKREVAQQWTEVEALTKEMQLKWEEVKAKRIALQEEGADLHALRVEDPEIKHLNERVETLTNLNKMAVEKLRKLKEENDEAQSSAEILQGLLRSYKWDLKKDEAMHI